MTSATLSFNLTEKIYADDTNLYVPETNLYVPFEIEPMVNDDLNQINDWFIANNLNLNTAKNEFMAIVCAQCLNSSNLTPVV